MRQVRPAQQQVRATVNARPITGQQQAAAQRMTSVPAAGMRPTAGMPAAQPPRPTYKYTPTMRNPPTAPAAQMPPAVQPVSAFVDSRSHCTGKTGQIAKKKSLSGKTFASQFCVCNSHKSLTLAKGIFAVGQGKNREFGNAI